jgi:hypothetical protein
MLYLILADGVRSTLLVDESVKLLITMFLGFLILNAINNTSRATALKTLEFVLLSVRNPEGIVAAKSNFWKLKYK